MLTRAVAATVIGLLAAALLASASSRAADMPALTPAQETSTMAALADPSAAVRQAAVTWLSEKQISSEALVDAAARYMEPGQPQQVRLAAAKILQNRGPRAARFASQMEVMLGDASRDVASAAAQALYSIDQAAVPLAPQLAARLKYPDPRIRVYAALLLGHMGPPAAPYAPQIAALLEDSNISVRRAAITTLGELGAAGTAYAEQIFPHLADASDPFLLDVGGPVRMSVRSAAARTLCGMAPAASPQVPKLTQALQSTDPAARQAAAEALGNLVCLGSAVTDAAPQLAPLLSDAVPEVRRAAAHALLYDMPARAAPFASRFPALLKDPDANVRAEVVYGLAKLGPAAAAVAPQIIPVLLDKDPQVRDNALSTLSYIGPKDTALIARLTPLLKNPDPHVHDAAARLLGQIKPAAAPTATPNAGLTAPQLLERLKDNDTRTSSAAAVALASRGPQVIPQLMALLKSPEFEAPDRAVKVLRVMGPAAAPAVPDLVAGLNDPHLQVSMLQALQALGSTAAPAAPQIAALLKQPEDYTSMQRRAVDTLSSVGPAGAAYAPDLAALLKPGTSPALKQHVIDALGLMGPKAAAVAGRLAEMLKDPDIEVRGAALQALARLDARAQAPELAAAMADADETFQMKVMQVLDRMAATAPLQDRDVLLQCLAAAGKVGPVAAAGFLLRAYVYRRTGSSDLVLIRWLGARPASDRPRPASLNDESAHAVLAAFTEVLDATRPIPALHAELAERTAELARSRGWDEEGLKRLDALQKRFAPEQPAAALAVRTAAAASRWQERLHASAALIATHAAFWIALIFAYPHVRWVQGFFFWNKWARRFLGAGYVGVLITLVPFLRRRMLLPFRDSLLPKALREHLSKATYFESCDVLLEKNRRTQPQRLALKETLSSIRGQVVIKGQSGLGKTLALLRLALASREPVVVLRATDCTHGVLAAIQKKLHGQLRDAAYLRSLIHAGGLKVLIDGLNEATPDARARITQFVEAYFRGDFILTTQPIGWEPPATARVYVLQPLLPEQIAPFLRQQWEGVESRATLSRTQYEAAVTAYVEALAGGPGGQEETRLAVLANPMQAALAAEQLARGETPDATALQSAEHAALSAPQGTPADPSLVALSNPMDATLAAELLARGETPDAFRLVEQRYLVMSAQFREQEGRDFRLQAFAEAVYAWRKSGESHLSTQGFEAEVSALVKDRLMLARTETITGQKGEEEVNRAFFRHDKILDFFLLPAFMGSPQRREAHTGDEPFWGVYELLALRLPATEERQLQQLLIDQAADTHHNELLNRYTQAHLLRQAPAALQVYGVPLSATQQGA